MMPKVGTLIVLLALVGCADAAQPPVADGPSDVADVLDVSCDGEMTTVRVPDVQARTDGVHVLVHNTSGSPVLAEWTGRGTAGGDGADPGDSTFRLGVLPGDAKFRCQKDTPDVDPGAPGGWVTFHIAEPAGWVDPELECSGGAMSNGIADYAPGAQGVDDPLGDAQEHAGAVATVEQAGYETGGQQTFVAIVDGAVDEAFTYHADGNGGWLLNTTDACG